MTYFPEDAPFLDRYSHEIKESLVIVLTLSVLAAYTFIPPFRSLADRAIDPAVAGITVLYSQATTEIYKHTGTDFGFVSPIPDPAFVFRVQLATYVNEKHGQPLVDMAANVRLPMEEREQALRALLRFESLTDWIQPFLNELSKGGLPGLYDDSPALNDLMKRIRAEGGIRAPIIRAYGEVVFLFLLNHPDAVLRKKAALWLSDVLAEEAIVLMAPRFEKEEDPAVRMALEQALWDIRAVGDRHAAVVALLNVYRKPPWPSLHIPVAVAMVRLGYGSARNVVSGAISAGAVSSEHKASAELAMAGTLYPTQIAISEADRELVRLHRYARERQHQLALNRQRLLNQQERMKRFEMARATVEPTPVATHEPPTKHVVKKTAPPKAVEPPVESAPPAPVSEPAQETKSPAASTLVEKAAPVPHQFSSENPTAPEPAEEKNPEQVASLPENLPPSVEEPVVETKPKSTMSYVDLVFQVGKQPAPLYDNAGGTQVQATLPAGTKGHADFEVLIGDEHWYQVKTKKGSGWAKGSLLTVFDLTGGSGVATAPTTQQEAPPDEGVDAASRNESTYFEAGGPNMPIFDKPSESAKKTGELKEATAYLAVKSEKINQDRWFLLQISSEETGWVAGINLQLANVPQPAELAVPKHDLSLRGKKSAFQAEWVVAGVKGVGVYGKPSIAGKMIEQISPPVIYKVEELLSGDGKEWYRIKLQNKKEGWVQALDVNLTKAPE